MSVEQTFHTPSFGDEEFDISPLTYAPAAAATRCSGQGVFGNQVPVEYLKRKLSCDQIQVYSPRHEENYTDYRLYNQHNLSHLRSSESQSQRSYLVHSSQGHMMNNNQYQQQQRSPQQDMYHQNMMGINMQPLQYDNQTSYSDASMQQSSLQPMQQMTMMSHQQQNHVMGPPQQMFSTINQSQLGLQIGMGTQHQGSSPGSNHNSPGLESSEDSDDSTPLAQLIGSKKLLNPEPVDTSISKIAKRPKPQKKKKKKDPNEPQKPVSAYALFFRDTQAAIKGQSPNASFGEVSKIVASMWDSLDVERKNSYKKKTETAKKEYLKALAAYRANLVSRAAVDQSDAMYGTSSPPRHSPNHSPPLHMMGMPQKLSPNLTSVVDSMQPVTSMHSHEQQQAWHMQSPNHMSPPGNNGLLQQQQQLLQQSHMSPTQQQLMQQSRMSPSQQQLMQQSRMSPSQQQMASIQPSPHASPSYNQNITAMNSGGNHGNLGCNDMSSARTCLRNGCSNPAIDSPDWDREYCSSECVVSHCKDVFVTWVAQRQVAANSYSTVK